MLRSPRWAVAPVMLVGIAVAQAGTGSSGMYQRMPVGPPEPGAASPAAVPVPAPAAVPDLGSPVAVPQPGPIAVPGYTSPAPVGDAPQGYAPNGAAAKPTSKSSRWRLLRRRGESTESAKPATTTPSAPSDSRRSWFRPWRSRSGTDQ
jgi:hypothetical protein